ncbi:uncharacterized protein LOC131623919 [Vicia villosa]|uniref:uncharacterized protein LOC131613108 n=1 Tax=Vicia villosa TaxID=3911 RepID=UPI00273A7E97|nr:uncharacterized protein LOC131613108 [Vicia villosa]XP_058750897.1 uncharacterized protein LOC131623919 [Vicia villosa]
MESWKNIPLSKEEEEGVVAADDEISGDEIFQRTLAGKLWTDNNFNSRAFTSTMISAWKLKNPVETQELNKNLFLFRFSTKRDLETVLRNGPWSFDRNLLVLVRISGEEQPSALNMHFGVFWVRIYELPLILRTEAMAKKIGGIIGVFEEMDQKEAHKNGRFLRVKVKMDLKQPLKRGTVVKFKDKTLRIHFKYERLPTFCFVCGRIGHQLKDCESLGDISEEGFEDIEEQDLSFGLWLRASPLPRITEEQHRKDSSSGTCSRSLFNISSSQSKCGSKGKEKEDEAEVEQHPVRENMSKEVRKEAEGTKQICNLAIESVAESLGAVEISKPSSNAGSSQHGTTKKKKWTRRKSVP